MALNATSVGNVRTDGNDSNAGFFDAALGTLAGANDRAWNNSPIIVDGATITATVHTTTTQVNVTGHTVSSADVGNVFRVTGGTGTAGLYRITAVDVPNNRWTVDVSAGSSTQTLTGRVGGALLSPGVASVLAASLAGAVFVKTGSYNITNAALGSAGCRLSIGATLVSGYDTTYGDDGVATLTVTASPLNARVLSFDATGGCGRNFIVDCAGFGASATAGSFRGLVINVTARNAGGNAFTANVHTYINCVADTTTSSGIGFSGTNQNALINCVARNCAGAGFSGNGIVVNSVATGCAGGGFTTTTFLYNCIAVGNTGWGFAGTVPQGVRVIDCAGYNNSSGDVQDSTWAVRFKTLSADPFVNSASGNYTLNTTAGGGAACRGVGFGAFSGLTSTVGYPDIGAVQAAAQAGGIPVSRIIGGV